MTLFVKDEQGQYVPATSKTIIKEGRSRTRTALKKGTDYIGSTEEAKEAIATLLVKYQREVFGCLFLDTKHRIIKWSELFFGTIDSTAVYPREVVKEALRVNAASVILAHNHPSGNSNPSRQDLELTRTLKEILLVVDVLVLDHIIVGDKLTSLSDKGQC
ncbi:MAG: DNA repair protein RadC [Desulfobulbaceae bacterium]|nr:DNA repair protein RadC [Desulfobulbaceae bacterium]